LAKRGEAQLRLGVIGLGRAAAAMIPSIVAHPHVALAAAADPNPAARARFTADYGAPAFESAEPLCASGVVDAVYIATPHQCHAADVEVAASHGMHVIVEKPMALELDDAIAMCASAKSRGVVLVVGHTHGFDRPIAKIREMVHGGDVGALRMMTNVVYTNFLYRPRRPEELDTALGGGIMYNQVQHSIEVVRTIDGGALRSVRAMTGAWDPARPTEGAMSGFLDFDSGAVASITYSGYDHFDADEFNAWVGENGEQKNGDGYACARRALRDVGDPEIESRRKAASGFSGRGANARPPGAVHHPHFGLLLVTCDGADLRPSPNGVLVYDDEGRREIEIPVGAAFPDKQTVIDELYDAVVMGVPPLHDGVWGSETVATGLALMASARERREVAIPTLVRDVR